MRFLYLLMLILALCTKIQANVVDYIAPLEGEELAKHMVELQVLTHKLGLSIDAENSPLIEFYLHESLIKVEEIQTLLPEYEGSPVALYIDRIAKPAYELLDESSEAFSKNPKTITDLKENYIGVINSCNSCHVASGRPEVVIRHNPFNPYLQDFSKPQN